MSWRVSRPLLLVGGVLFLFTVVLVLRPGDDPPAERPGTPSNRAGRATGTDRREVDVTDVKIEALRGHRDALLEGARNPFRFQQKAPPPLPPAPPSGSRTVEPPPPPVPAGPPLPPPIPLRFQGIYETSGDMRVASLVDGRGNVFNVKQGDIIEGRYKMLQVGPDSIEIAYLDGRGRQTIRLSGQ